MALGGSYTHADHSFCLISWDHPPHTWRHHDKPYALKLHCPGLPAKYYAYSEEVDQEYEASPRYP